MLIKDFLAQLNKHKAWASFFKRCGLYAAEYGLTKLIVPGWLQSPFKFAVLSTAGSASKNLFWWVISPKKNVPSSDQPLTFVGTDADLNSLQFVVGYQTDNEKKLAFKRLPQKVKIAAQNAVNAAGNYVINVTLEDLLEGTGATLGSGLATGVFVIVVGPPSLLSLPLYYCLEAPLKSLFAFIGKHVGKLWIGPRVAKPALQYAFGTRHPSAENPETPENDDLGFELEEFNADEEEIVSGEEFQNLLDKFLLIGPFVDKDPEEVYTAEANQLTEINNTFIPQSTLFNTDLGDFVVMPDAKNTPTECAPEFPLAHQHCGNG